MNVKIKILILGALSFALSACSFFDKDNTPPPAPLKAFRPEVNTYAIWNTRPGSGSHNEHVKLNIALTPQFVLTADHYGLVTATHKLTGAKVWCTQTGIVITSGPATGDNLVLVGGSSGEVVALSQTDGKIVWRALATSEVLAPPTASQGITIAKSIDGKLSAFASCDGHLLWNYEQTEPPLLLRGSSAPQIQNNIAVIGFANGNLTKLTLREGSLLWLQTIAIPQGCFSIQRMVDIDADPILWGPHIYAATYQGKIAALELATGKELWSHDISSYAGIATDGQKVYVSDAQSHLWAFDAACGTVSWRQNQLEARNITGPAIMGNYIVVGDGEGYLHWLSRQDGHFVARVRIASSAILATPVVDCGIVYVTTKDGRLQAYRLI